MAVVVCLLVLLPSVVFCGGRDYEVRGLDPHNKHRYHPGKDFTCLDGSDTIAFSMGTRAIQCVRVNVTFVSRLYYVVNDDYCDCLDGSDEPGTAACPTGGFYCQNRGHKPATIFSSRVDDGTHKHTHPTHYVCMMYILCVCIGICDCCDGSDEWWGETECVNMCIELGKKEELARLEREAIYAQGYEKRVQYEQQGIRTVSRSPSLSLFLSLNLCLLI